VTTMRVESGDGALDAHLALPAAGSGPGLLLLHEIFGVDDYVRT
jgi:carboxymethylenebutenolidase